MSTSSVISRGFRHIFLTTKESYLRLRNIVIADFLPILARHQ